MAEVMAAGTELDDGEVVAGCVVDIEELGDPLDPHAARDIVAAAIVAVMMRRCSAILYHPTVHAVLGTKSSP